MRVFRAIYRLDFARNYDMINKPGTVARLLHESLAPDASDFVGEDRSARRIMLRRLLKDEIRCRVLTVEPVAIVCEIERAKGIEVRDLTEDPDFRALCAAASSVLKEFEIRQFERAGLRLFLFGSNAESVESSVTAFKALMSPKLASSVESVLGPSNDVGFAFDGMADSKVSYHFRAGPFVGSQEYAKYFSNINELLPNELGCDTVIDLDLFESKFAYTAASAHKWCEPQLAVAAELSKNIAHLIHKDAKQ